MEVQNNLAVKRLKVTSLQEQEARQRLDEDWRPLGSERFAYQAALQDEMPVVAFTGAHSGALYPERRFAPAGSLEEDGASVRKAALRSRSAKKS